MAYSSDDMKHPENQFCYQSNSFDPTNPDNQIVEKNKTSTYAPRGYGEERALHMALEDLATGMQLKVIGEMEMASIPEEINLKTADK